MNKIYDLLIGKTPKYNGVSMKLSHLVSCIPGDCMLSQNKEAKPFTKLYKSPTSLRKFLKENKQEQSGYHTFISINAYHRNAKTYGTNYAVGMTAIVIDIDFHDADDPELKAEELVMFLNSEEGKECMEEHGIPIPSVLCHTGRGVQICYPLETASIKLSWLRKMIASGLCDKYETLLSEYPITFSDAEVDRLSSERTDGLFRAPFSWNPNARRYVVPYLFSDKRWDINELKDAAGIKAEKKTAQTENRQRSYSLKKKDRAAVLESLVKSGYVPDSRNELLFAYAVDIIKDHDPDTTLEMLRDLNQHFSGTKGPLPDAELRATVRSVDKHGYKLSNKEFSKKTGIDLECFYEKRDSNRARNKRNKAKKKKTVNDIVKYHKMGFSLKQIMQLTGKCENTVRKYLKPVIKNEKQREINKKFNAARKKLANIKNSCLYKIRKGYVPEWVGNDRIGRIEYLEELLEENRARCGPVCALEIFQSWKERGLLTS